jgi:LAGLIDADG-like domain
VQETVRSGSENIEVRTISREVVQDRSQDPGLTPQRLHAELLEASASGAWAYLHGALHDATFSRRHGTVRFGQSDRRWLDLVSASLARLDRRAWIYREGRTRRFWILETSAAGFDDRPSFESVEEKVMYARGYFDAEGGIPRNAGSRLYIQLVQKDREDLEHLRLILETLGIACGKLHNPSVAVDSDLWRFYVLARSHEGFMRRVSSWHPRKRRLFEARLASNQDEDIVHAP